MGQNCQLTLYRYFSSIDFKLQWARLTLVLKKNKDPWVPNWYFFNYCIIFHMNYKPTFAHPRTRSSMQEALLLTSTALFFSQAVRWKNIVANSLPTSFIHYTFIIFFSLLSPSSPFCPFLLILSTIGCIQNVYALSCIVLYGC